MIGWPLAIAFSSLVVYYLIGVIAQFIKLWLGKRLPAAVLAKYDTGKYELKTTLNKLKTKVRNLEEKEGILLWPLIR